MPVESQRAMVSLIGRHGSATYCAVDIGELCQSVNLVASWSRSRELQCWLALQVGTHSQDLGKFEVLASLKYSGKAAEQDQSRFAGYDISKNDSQMNDTQADSSDLVLEDSG
jgi:hypothetical protein